MAKTAPRCTLVIACPFGCREKLSNARAPLANFRLRWLCVLWKSTSTLVAAPEVGSKT